jgi:hypothetical protein
MKIQIKYPSERNNNGAREEEDELGEFEELGVDGGEGQGDEDGEEI